MIDQDTVIIPGSDRQGTLDRRYDVRIAKRIQDVEKLIEESDSRLQVLSRAEYDALTPDPLTVYFVLD
jgi:hypothetical protein